MPGRASLSYMKPFSTKWNISVKKHFKEHLGQFHSATMYFLTETTLLYAIIYLDESQHTNFHSQIYILLQLKELRGYPDQEVAEWAGEVASPVL